MDKAKLKKILKDHSNYLESVGKKGSKADLSNADLMGADLRGADLRDADLRDSDLSNANLWDADLMGANLMSADLSNAKLGNTNLSNANLKAANLMGADLIGADLRGADLRIAVLQKTTFYEMKLDENTKIGFTIFADVDLSEVKNLDIVNNQFPSSISIDTIMKSKGKISKVFLKRAGVPQNIIDYLDSFIYKPIDFYSCFISYSSNNADFAERLYSDLMQKNIRCFYAPEDMKTGDKLRDRIEESIKIYDKLLLVLSEDSINSQWVEAEVEAALEKEKKQNSTVLFPIKIDDSIMDIDKGWASLIRRTIHIGDFTKWKTHDDYQEAFERLLKDLKLT